MRSQKKLDHLRARRSVTKGVLQILRGFWAGCCIVYNIQQSVPTVYPLQYTYTKVLHYVYYIQYIFSQPSTNLSPIHYYYPYPSTHPSLVNIKNWRYISLDINQLAFSSVQSRAKCPTLWQLWHSTSLFFVPSGQFLAIWPSFLQLRHSISLLRSPSVQSLAIWPSFLQL